jgi:hypothetical protein
MEFYGIPGKVFPCIPMINSGIPMHTWASRGLFGEFRNLWRFYGDIYLLFFNIKILG